MVKQPRIKRLSSASYLGGCDEGNEGFISRAFSSSCHIPAAPTGTQTPDIFKAFDIEYVDDASPPIPFTTGPSIISSSLGQYEEEDSEEGKPVVFKEGEEWKNREAEDRTSALSTSSLSSIFRKCILSRHTSRTMRLDTLMEAFKGCSGGDDEWAALFDTPVVHPPVKKKRYFKSLVWC